MRAPGHPITWVSCLSILGALACSGGEITSGGDGVVAGCDFQCGDGRCIASYQKCNGTPNCSDGSDEAGCQETCDPGQYQCLDGKCLARDVLCNGRKECSSGDDEVCGGKGCDPGMFVCGDGKCIDGKQRCDGKNDCTSGIDEQGCGPPVCKPDEGRCGANGKCYPASEHCNHTPFCPGGEDETGCSGGAGTPPPKPGGGGGGTPPPKPGGGGGGTPPPKPGGGGTPSPGGGGRPPSSSPDAGPPSGGGTPPGGGAKPPGSSSTPSSDACEPGLTEQGKCVSSTVLRYCVGDEAWQETCETGTTCGDDPDYGPGYKNCVATSSAGCDSTYTIDGTCAGDIVKWCKADKPDDYDCGALGKTCGVVPSPGHPDNRWCVDRDDVAADPGDGSCKHDGRTLDYEGECDYSTGIVYWCEGTTLKSYDCQKNDSVDCGYDTGAGFYDCLYTSADTPITCQKDGVDLGSEGECDYETGMIYWCEGTTLKSYDCQKNDSVDCGYDTGAGFYDCLYASADTPFTCQKDGVDLGPEGECDDSTGIVYWCEGTALESLSCPNGCGWTGTMYDCKEADPGGGSAWCNHNGWCDANEDAYGCPEDCACGDGECQMTDYEYANCPYECTV